ncbi:MAG: NAD+ synthase [Cyanobacteria bacterium QS_8_64_29]|nr:MAG: NAD+ synthase [Cyanobacteria bacterium QS_8_64_29]
MKVAIAQLNPTIGNFSGNAAGIRAEAEQAVAAGAQLLLTPELSLCGYPPRDLLLEPDFIEAAERHRDELAQALPPQLAVLVGLPVRNPQAAERGENPLFNSIALLQGGRAQRYFHKRLLPSYDVFDEERYFAAGRCSNCLTLQDGDRALTLGITICEDLWNDAQFWGQRHYPTDPLAELAAQQPDAIVNLAASPYRAGKPQLREVMLAHGARRYGIPIAYLNQVGGNDDLIFDGASVALDGRGQVAARARAFGADRALWTFDAGRRDWATGPTASRPQQHCAEIWSALVLGLQDYARKCGFATVVLGLSGGIDSALVAALAAEALGPERVLGVLMPSPYSSAASLADARALVANLGIDSREIPIGETMQAYDRMLAPLFAGTAFGAAEENVQSRIRGNLLMAIANKFGHLLLATGNKSELAVGYCTLYGDMCGGLAVIADVPKTQVYALCRWRNQTATCERIPARVLEKPPSAELRPDQKDEDTLPAYPTLDGILHGLIQQRCSAAELVEVGYDAGAVERVVALMAQSEFKRRQAPPTLKVAERAFGPGWRMPIASQHAFARLASQSPS